MPLVKQSHRTAWVGAPTVVELDPGISKPWRLLTLWCSFSNASPNGIIPCLRLLGSGGQILGQWCAFGHAGGSFASGGPLYVMASTAPQPQTTTDDPIDGTAYYANICFPQDLVVLDNESLQLVLLGIGAGVPVPDSEIFFTIAIEP